MTTQLAKYSDSNLTAFRDKLDGATNWIPVALDSQYYEYTGKGNTAKVEMSASEKALLDKSGFIQKFELLGYKDYVLNNSNTSIFENINWVHIGVSAIAGALAVFIVNKIL